MPSYCPLQKDFAKFCGQMEGTLRYKRIFMCVCQCLCVSVCVMSVIPSAHPVSPEWMLFCLLTSVLKLPKRGLVPAQTPL